MSRPPANGQRFGSKNGNISFLTVSICNPRKKVKRYFVMSVEITDNSKEVSAAIKAALADEDSRYHSVVTCFMEFHRDDVGPDIAAELFPGTDPSKLSFAEMVDFLKLKRFGSLVDSEMNQQVFILDLSFNPEITDELMVIYFDLNKEIFCITHES